MKITRLSENQRFVFRWWTARELSDYDGIICDGAVRSGKTFCLSASFMTWAMTNFDECIFGLCSKTIVSLKRNILPALREYMKAMGMTAVEVASKNYMDVSFCGRKNRFYYFGGRDEGSPSLIQGVTLAGVLLDEAALMPRSFIEQAVARCSVAGSKLWFNCNPDNPYHWFKKEWIDKAEEKRLIYRHFVLEDNPTLDRAVIERYHRIYTGTFYERFVLGKWTAAEGLVYPMFDEEKNVFEGDIQCERYVISCDYGTVNPSSFGLWGESGGVWYRLREYYYDSRREGMQKTDEEHYKGLEELADGLCIEKVICDPSAASFIQYHWFKKEWIDKAEEKRLIYRHFVLEDNPTLDRAVIERYHRIYTGTFYERFVLGKWTAAEGLVYPMFDEEKNVFEGDIQCERYVISCDYGTVNPSSFGLWGESGGVWYRLREYYYDSRREGMQKTDEEHYKGLEELADGLCIEKVICDPSAASFIQCIRRHGKFTVQPAKNDVVSGIRLVSDCIKDGRIRINRRCRDTLREINLYRWDEKAGKDAPVKENDHAMDDMRYFAAECLGREKDDFFVLTVEH